MAQWSDAILNRHVAPGIATFTSADIPEPVMAGEKVEHWLANHFLNSVFRAQYEGKLRQLAFNLIYRAQACFEAFEQARALTQDYLSASSPGAPKTGRYYKALRAWEGCFLNLQNVANLVNHVGSSKVFEPRDGSPEQRAYDIANAIKHWSDDIQRDVHEDGDTVPMWLTNEGFTSRRASLTYVELSGLLTECAIVANDLMDPLERSQANK